MFQSGRQGWTITNSRQRFGMQLLAAVLESQERRGLFVGQAPWGLLEESAPKWETLSVEDSRCGCGSLARRFENGDESPHSNQHRERGWRTTAEDGPW